jgi:hypothetical protein
LDKKFSSILDELADYVPKSATNSDLFIEGRAIQVISSVTHLMNLIKENYDPETADELTRRLFNSIKSQDDGKFRRKIQQIRESKDPKKKV